MVVGAGVVFVGSGVVFEGAGVVVWLGRVDPVASLKTNSLLTSKTHPSVLRRLEKGSFYRFKLVEGTIPAP